MYIRTNRNKVDDNKIKVKNIHFSLEIGLKAEYSYK